MGRPQTPETRKKISVAMQEARARARTPYLPEGRRCAKCNVFKPAKEFYIYYRELVSGDKVPHLYPRCKSCEAKRSRAYISNLPIEERRRREAKYKRDMRKRMKKNQRPPLVPAKPFADWFLSLNGTAPTHNEMGERLARAVYRATSGEVQKIHLDIVDEVGVLVGETYLIHTLYGGL